MRRVTAKPPNILTAVSTMAAAAAPGVVRPDELIRWDALVAIALTCVNMFGGFAVTRRLLAMFRN